MAQGKFLPYARQKIDESDCNAVVQALLGETITRGDYVAKFERAIADFVGASYAVAFNNGSTALFAAYQALDCSSSDLLITTPNTFVATASAGKRLGMAMKYSDIDQFGNMDFSSVIDTINTSRSRGKVVLAPVHFAGVACDMASLSQKIKNPNVAIIEDAAHALGSTYPDGSYVGSCAYSDMTIFSFHPAKNITTGEGGMVTTNDENLYHRLLRLRNSGIERETLVNEVSPKPYYYEVQEISCNYHLTDFQAALGLSQLKKLSTFHERKKKLVAAYRKRLSSIPGIQLPPKDGDHRTHYHLFVVRMPFKELGISREECMNQLKDKGIGTQLHYVPLYYHPALGSCPKNPKDSYPKMEEYYQTALSLPFFHDMTEDDVDRVAQALRQVILLGK